jgi:dienelactone hydrolase
MQQFRIALLGLLVFPLSATFAQQPLVGRNVRINTADDVGIMATYYAVDADKAPAVVLVHSVEQTRDAWKELLPLLLQNKIAALAIDLRGHGESTRKLTTQGPKLLDVKNFTQRDFEDMLLDVNAAVEWLMGQPGTDKKAVGLVGGSVGANLALRYAMFNEDVAALLLLSPGMNYRGIRADDAIRKIAPIPIRFVVSRHDPFALESCGRLLEMRQEAGYKMTKDDVTICTGNLHGTDMITGVKKLPPIMIDWLKQTLAGISTKDEVPLPKSLQ